MEERTTKVKSLHVQLDLLFVDEKHVILKEESKCTKPYYSNTLFYFPSNIYKNTGLSTLFSSPVKVALELTEIIQCGQFSSKLELHEELLPAEQLL